MTDEQILEATVSTPENPQRPEDRYPSSPDGSGQYGQGWQGRPPPPGYGQPRQPSHADSQQPDYGQQPGYGRQPGYPPPPPPDYGTRYGADPNHPVGMPPYAGWGQRVGAWLIDNLVATIGAWLLDGYYADWARGVRVVGWVITVIGVVWAVYNAYLAGQTGQSTGKRMMNIRLARFADGQVVGPAYGLLRLFMNFVFWVVCLIPGLLNYLWPLWDAKSQTWSDKIASSVVVKAR